MFNIDDLIYSHRFTKLSDIVIDTPNDMKGYNGKINNHPNNILIVFVRTNYVNDFNKNLDTDKKIILITHNSDIRVTDKQPTINTNFRHANPKFIHKNIVHWFASNLTYKHDKFTAIPVGLEREMFFYGINKHEKILNSITNNKIDKVYLNCNTKTDFFGNREKIYSTLSKNIWVTSVRGKNGLDFVKYINELSEHKYCFCPVGNTEGFNDEDGGASSIRFWECQYLGVIPIVKDTLITSFFNDLPQIKVDKWENINKEFLNEEYKKIKRTHYNYEKLKFNYWAKLINSYKNIDKKNI